MTEEKKEEQETFTKEEAETMVSEKLAEQQESFDTKMEAKVEEIKEELKPEEVKPPEGEAPKYVDESWTPKTYNDLMAKVVDIVKEHVKPADVEGVSKQVMDSLKEEQKQAKDKATEADKEWDNQITELKKEEKLDDKTITEIISKAIKWNKENPDGLITSMKLAHEYWKKDEKKETKPRIPGAPTNNADDEDEQKIFASTEEAQAYWLATHGE